MRKLTLLLAMAVALSLSGLAQTSTDQSSSTQTQTTTKHKHTKKSAAESSSTETSEKGMKSSAKESTLTGCLSGPNSENAFVLTNGRYRKGVEVGGDDSLKDHVGHKVKLTGMWEKSGEEIGENEAAGKGAKGHAMEKHFKVTKIDHLADTCTAPAAKSMSGMSGMESGSKKGKGKKSSTTTPPPGF